VQSPHDLIKAYKRDAKKRFGQHFLSDPSILQNIADAADVREGDAVLEIGPGPGTLTSALLARGANVTAIEIDTDAQDFLEEQFGDLPNFTLVRGDALTVNLPELLETAPSWKCAANLPYNVGTPIFFLLTEHAAKFERLALMFQREVALRMVATPEERSDYGVLSLMTQLYHDASIALTLPPGAFFPPPKVYSAVVALSPIEKARIEDPELRRVFERVIKACFQKRRKTLPNGLKGLGIEKASLISAIEGANIDPRARPETLDFDQFVALSEKIAGLG